MSGVLNLKTGAEPRSNSQATTMAFFLERKIVSPALYMSSEYSDTQSEI